jgi:hypothetical protein
VLVNGDIVDCSPEEHSDLFWAMCGAGSAFAIAVELKLRLVDPPVRRSRNLEAASFFRFRPIRQRDLHPFTPPCSTSPQAAEENGIYGGLLFFLAGEDERFEKLLRTWGEIVSVDDSNDWTCHAVVSSPPVSPFDGQRTVILHAGWIGVATAEEAKAQLEKRLAPIIALGPVVNGLGFHTLPEVSAAPLAHTPAQVRDSPYLPLIASLPPLIVHIHLPTAQQHARPFCNAEPKVALDCVLV